MHIGTTVVALRPLLFRQPKAVILIQKYHVKHVADDVPHYARPFCPFTPLMTAH